MAPIHERIAPTLLAGLFFAGALAITGVPRFGSWEHQPIWVALAAIVPATMLAASSIVARAVAIVVAGVVLAVIVFVPGIPAEWAGTGTRAIAWTGCVAASLSVAGTEVFAANRSRSVDELARVVLLGAGVAAIALRSGYAKFALLGGVLVAAFAIAAIPSLLSRPRRVPGTLRFAFIITWLALVAGAWFHVYADRRAPAAAFAILAAAPFAALAGDLGAAGDSDRHRAIRRVASVGIVVAIAIALAYLSAEEGAGEGDEYE